MVKKLGIALALALSTGLLGQEKCPTIFLGSGVNLPFPSPLSAVVVTSVTPGTHVKGNCPLGWCVFKFDVEVDVYTPAGFPGQTFDLCFPPGPICVPFSIPHEPNKPDYTQYMDENFEISVQCGQQQLLELWMDQLFGPIRIVNISMTCGGC